MSGLFYLAWRLPLLLLHLLSGAVQELLYYLLLGKSWYLKPAGRHAIRLWMRQLAFILGLEIKVTGTADSYNNTLIVANHVSWLDIIALASVRNITFMAKSDVKHWPIIGQLTAGCGTLFIRRGSKKDLKQAISNITQLFSQGETVAIFPEGTTSEGEKVLEFYNGLFAAALNAESYLQPVAIFYSRNQQRDPLAPYTLKDTFVSHLLTVLQQDRISVTLQFLAKLRTQPYTRSQLAMMTHQRIAKALQHADHGQQSVDAVNGSFSKAL